jgi:hypothetical protein
MHENQILKFAAHYVRRRNVLQNFEIADLIIVPLKMIIFYEHLFSRIF